MKKVSEALRELGFFKTEDNLENLRDFASKLVLHAGSETRDGAFECHPSFIPLQSFDQQHQFALVIDIGGTSTKAGIREVAGDGKETWTYLFEADNDDFDREESDKSSFICFLEALSEDLAVHLEKAGYSPSNISNCAVVFSNSLKNRLLKDNQGITGIIASSSQYRKGEWFNRDIKDGDDIGQAFIEAFSENGFPIEHFVITNDTPFTLKAHRNADGGVVVSTGLNGTFVKTAWELGISESEQYIICNGEMGRGLEINEEFRSSSDLVDPGKKADTVEYLTSGKFLPRLFAHYIVTLAESGCGEFEPLATFLRGLGPKYFEHFKTSHLSLLVQDPEKFLAEQEYKNLYNDQMISSLVELADQIITRSAKLAALVVYTTVSNRFSDRDCFVIALDSRLAREIPFYRKTLNNTLEELTPEGKTLSAVLLHPVTLEEGIISVPMLGAANTLDCFF